LLEPADFLRDCRHIAPWPSRNTGAAHGRGRCARSARVCVSEASHPPDFSAATPQSGLQIVRRRGGDTSSGGSGRPSRATPLVGGRRVIRRGRCALSSRAEIGESRFHRGTGWHRFLYSASRRSPLISVYQYILRARCRLCSCAKFNRTRLERIRASRRQSDNGPANPAPLDALRDRRDMQPRRPRNAILLGSGVNASE
jgi:hypothetical protein